MVENIFNKNGNIFSNVFVELIHQVAQGFTCSDYVHVEPSFFVTNVHVELLCFLEMKPHNKIG